MERDMGLRRVAPYLAPKEEGRYEIGNVLGSGNFGRVFECRDSHIDSDHCNRLACKVIEKKKIGRDNLKDLVREVSVMNHLRDKFGAFHRSIVCLHRAYQDDEAVRLIMERGVKTLAVVLKEQGGRFSEAVAFKVMTSVMQGIGACHSVGVVHADIKLENIIFVQNDQHDDVDVKLCDFGLSDFLHPRKRFRFKCGTPLYMAPEIWEKRWGHKADIWAAGVCLYVMLSGEYPFRREWFHESLQEKLLQGVNFSGREWEKVSAEGKSLLQRMLQPDPDMRISAKSFLEHPWIRREDRHTDRQQMKKLLLQGGARYKRLTQHPKRKPASLTKTFRTSRITKTLSLKKQRPRIKILFQGALVVCIY